MIEDVGCGETEDQEKDVRTPIESPGAPELIPYSAKNDLDFVAPMQSVLSTIAVDFLSYDT